MAVVVPKFFGFGFSNRLDQLICKSLGSSVNDPEVGVATCHRMPDRVQQVGLSQPYNPVNKQRVISLARSLGDGSCGGVSESVATAHDIVVECVSGVQPISVTLEKRAV